MQLFSPTVRSHVIFVDAISMLSKAVQLPVLSKAPKITKFQMAEITADS